MPAQFHFEAIALLIAPLIRLWRRDEIARNVYNLK